LGSVTGTLSLRTSSSGPFNHFSTTNAFIFFNQFRMWGKEMRKSKNNKKKRRLNGWRRGLKLSSEEAQSVHSPWTYLDVGVSYCYCCDYIMLFHSYIYIYAFLLYNVSFIVFTESFFTEIPFFHPKQEMYNERNYRFYPTFSLHECLCNIFLRIKIRQWTTFTDYVA
jgi:hypothetical protein